VKKARWKKLDGSDVNEVKMLRYTGIYFSRKYSTNNSLPRLMKESFEIPN